MKLGINKFGGLGILWGEDDRYVIHMANGWGSMFTDELDFQFADLSINIDHNIKAIEFRIGLLGFGIHFHQGPDKELLEAVIRESML